MKKPHYPLDRVRELVVEGCLLLRKTTALDHFDTPLDGYQFAIRVVLELHERHFAETSELAVDVADVYALRFCDRGWYIKLFVDEDVPEVVFVSLHPLEHPIRTNDGEVSP